MSYIDIEEKVLHILLNDKDVVKTFKSIDKQKQFFDKKHLNLIDGILWALDKDSLLTRLGYDNFLTNVKIVPSHEDKLSELSIFDSILYQTSKSSEFNILIESVKNNWLEKSTADAINKFKIEKTKSGNKKAISLLKNKLSEIENFSDRNKNEFVQIHEFKDYTEDLKRRRENPSEIIKTYIPELDWAIPRGLAPGHFTVFSGDSGSGKCVWENEKLPTEDGKYISCKELFNKFNNNEKIKLISMKNDLTLYTQEVSNIFRNGIKEVFEVKTQSGFSCKITSNHPVYTTNGYIDLKDLNIGEYIAINRKGFFGKDTISDEEAMWLGFMISDGGTTSNYRFTNIDKDIVKTMRNCCKKLGGNFKQVKNNGKLLCSYSVKKLRHLGEKYNIDRTLSIHKYIDDQIYSWNEKSLSNLLKAMYSCDGGIENKSNISYYTSSSRLAEDVRNLLLKFNIRGVIREKMSSYKKTDGSRFYRMSYRVLIYNSKDILTFINKIGFIGKKDKKSRKLLLSIKKTKKNPNYDLIPKYFCDQLKLKYQKENKFYELRKQIKQFYCKDFNGSPKECTPVFNSQIKNGISRYKLDIISKVLNDEKLSNLANSDIYWDKIVSIESIGMYETYDISMPNDHNFVVNNVITHNSSIMLNVAINIYKFSKYKILYIPIEMSVKEVFDKIIGRETKIPLRTLSDPNKTNLKDSDIEKVQNELKKWENCDNRFSILKMFPGCTTEEMQFEIEKRCSWFKPDVVFVDYMDLMRPRERMSRSDQEISSIIHDLRTIGGQLKFSVVTAAQLTRDSLKRLSEKGKSQTEFSSKDVRGGQAVTADSDNVFCQIPDINSLDIYIIKSRFGGKSFQNGSGKASLAYDPSIGLIQSQFQNDALVLSPDQDTDFSFSEPPATINNNDDNPF